MYLGHVVSDKGIQTNPKKEEAIWKWPIPTNVTEVCWVYQLLLQVHQEICTGSQTLYKLISGKNAMRK